MHHLRRHDDLDTSGMESGNRRVGGCQSLRRPDPREEWYLHLTETLRTSTERRIVLITGVSPESIGSSIALSIASQAPALLIFASRTESKLEQVRKSLRDAYPEVTVKTVLLDLMSQDSVKTAAAEVSQLADRLDLIINNAGLMTQARQTTKDGIEGQFGANHIGHFLLTNLLLPQLLKSATSSTSGATRVINLTSLGHRLSPVRFSDYNLEKSNDELPEEERHALLCFQRLRAKTATTDSWPMVRQKLQIFCFRLV